MHRLDAAGKAMTGPHVGETATSWVIIVIGVGIFGTFTGYLANLFLAPKQAPSVEASGDIHQQVDCVRTRLAQQKVAVDELDTLI